MQVGLYQPEYVVKVDGKRYIARDEGFWNTNIFYYDYINIFVSGNQVRMEKDGKGKFDPRKNKIEYEFDY